jgi:hypothetical protein
MTFLIIHYLSASRLKKYLQCTEAYYQAYENKVRSEAVHLRFGTMVHKVFERWFQEEKDILEIYEEEWRVHDVVDPEYYKDGIEIVQNFADSTDRDATMSLGFEYAFAINIVTDEVIDTTGVDFDDREQAKEFLSKLEEDDSPYIFGFIDRVDYDMDTDTLHIIDYKTSRIALTKSEADVDEQLSMYALVAKYLFPEYDNVLLELDYVRLGEKVRSFRTDEELVVFKDWLIHMYHQIKNDVSPKPTLNKYCGWCDSRQGCSAYQELIHGELEDFSAEDFENLDGELEDVNIKIKILTGRKKEIEGQFKEELKRTDNTPIDVGGSERYVANNARVNYDVSTVITAFPDKFDGLLSVKKKEVDTLAKGNPEILEMLAETAEKYYISPTLRKKKKKED